MRSFLIRMTSLSAIVVVLLAGFLGWAYYSTQAEPDFYRQALAVAPEVHAEAGQAFEVEALELHNQIVAESTWRATFTDDQINGWLAVDLPSKFPNSVPRSVEEPRLHVTDGAVTLACRYRSRNFNGVLQLECEPFLTENPNELALKVCQLKSGVIPLPLNRWLDQVSRESAKLGVPIRWTQRDGSPVALIDLPLDQVDETRDLEVQELSIREGELSIAGRSHSREDSDLPEAQTAQNAAGEEPSTLH